jgi:4'-phosphopantetheinyl transferase
LKSAPVFGMQGGVGTLDLSEWSRAQRFGLRREEGRHEGTLVCLRAADFARLKERPEAILHPRELATYLRLPAERRRQTYLLGRAAAKAALADRLGVADLAEVEIRPGVFHDPVVHFPMPEPWSVSITHAEHGAAALAFPSVHPLAIDLEEIDEERAKVMASQCAESEIAETRQATGVTRAVACAILWTAKEGAAKVLKTGMMVAWDTVLRTGSIRAAGGGAAEGVFPALGQYGFKSWIGAGSVLTIVLPRKSTIEFEAGAPEPP